MNDCPNESVATRATSRETIQVLCIVGDEDYAELIATRLADHDDLEVSTETDPEAALNAVDGVDCIVSDCDMPDADGLELLAAVRERAPTLPVVLFGGSDHEEVAGPFPEETWTEFLRKDDPEAAMSVLAGRVRRLVDHHRTHRTVNRSLTAIEATGDGIATVSPDGTFSFVNRVFASRFGVEPDDLIGRPWQTCFPDCEVERLESTALRTVRDGWQWTGGCVCETDDGETFTAQTRVAGLDDGSFVFCLTDSREE